MIFLLKFFVVSYILFFIFGEVEIDGEDLGFIYKILWTYILAFITTIALGFPMYVAFYLLFG